MNACRRLVVFFSFLSFCVGIILICVALATDHWIVAKPIRKTLNNVTVTAKTGDTTHQNIVNSSQIFDYSSDEFSDEDANLVTFGLFKGVRKLNYGLGARPAYFNVRHEIKSGVSFIDLGTWIAVILFAVLALFWSIIGAIFSLINVIFVTQERLTGPVGLYVWSTLAMLSAFASTAIFVAQYFLTMLHNVLLQEQIEQNWTTDELAWFDYSFWLLVGGLGSFTANIFVLLLAGVEMKTVHFDRDKSGQIDSGAFMY